MQQRGVRGHSGLNFTGRISLEETGVHMHQVVEHRQTNIRTHSFAYPRNEVEAHERARGENHDEGNKQAQGLIQQCHFATGKAAIDHQANSLAQR